MKIFVTNFEIRPLPPNRCRNATGHQKLPPVGLEIKLLSFSPPKFDLVFGTPAKAIATVAAVETVHLPSVAYGLSSAPLATLSWKGGCHVQPSHYLSQNF
jgi:hypothetical protein